MDEATIQRCSQDQCVNRMQQFHKVVKPTRPGYCSWCWGEIPIYRVRGVMLHDIKEPEYTYTVEVFDSVDKGQGWIDGDWSDAFVDSCNTDIEIEEDLEGYRFDDFEIVRIASIEFPIEILEVM